VNFHNKSTIHTIEQVTTGDGHIELNQVRITPEEAEKDTAQTKGKDNRIYNAVTQQWRCCTVFGLKKRNIISERCNP